jgi:hypothetical protein
MERPPYFGEYMNEEYEQARLTAGSMPIPDIGEIREIVSKESHGLRTVIRFHGRGFSMTQYRRTFQHNGQVEIPGTSQWHIVRHQEWSARLSYDWLDEAYHDVAPSQPIKGDRDD